MAIVSWGIIIIFYTFLHPSRDSTTNSDRPIHRLNGDRQIVILLLFFTLFNTHHHIQQQIQIDRLYIVLMASVRLGYYYYFLHFFYTHHQIQQQIQIGLYIVLMASVRFWYYYYFLHFFTPITGFNNKFR